MKVLFSSALSIVLLAASSLAIAQTEPVKVPTLYNKLYAPGGFDSNDNVQVVGEGLFKNSCYRHAETSVQVDQDRKQIVVGPVAYEYSGFCLQVILPFERVMEVGILKPGKWTVLQGATMDKLGELNVRQATSDAADDFLYAPISQAFFHQNGLKSEVLLAGEFPNECLVLEDVKVTIETDVLVLQPIAKMLKKGSCKDGKFPFSKAVPIEMIPNGRYLLHVRSMNGNAINTLVQVN